MGDVLARNLPFFTLSPITSTMTRLEGSNTNIQLKTTSYITIIDSDIAQISFINPSAKELLELIPHLLTCQVSLYSSGLHCGLLLS